MTKIIWGVNIPYQSTEIDWEATHREERNTAYSPRGFSPVRVPCIRIHKQMSFELCDICGDFIPYGRISRRITTCSPKCNAKKWDDINGLIITRERNASGVRPTSFWITISSECFKRDNYTCQKCHKTRAELQALQQSERNKPGYKPEDYILNCHHIKEIKDGGNNKLENLITLCGKDHKLEHSRVEKIRRMHKQLVYD